MIEMAPPSRMGRRTRAWLISLIALAAAALLGSRADARWLALLIVAAGGIVLLWRPVLGIFALAGAALLLPLEIGTGTEVALNPSVLLVPVLTAVWLLHLMQRGEGSLGSGRVVRPLLLFLAAALLSLVIGTVLWDPAVPRSGSFLLVQLAQWGIFALSGGIFIVAGDLMRETAWLRRLTFFFLALAGASAVIFVLPEEIGLVRLVQDSIFTVTLIRAPFWLLLGALAAGQLLFNHELSLAWRGALVITLAAVLVAVFYIERETLSHAMGVAAVLAVLIWLRWPGLRRFFLIAGATSLIFLTPLLYEYAGGADEWIESGGSRLALIGRVVEVTMRNPITGLGPAAYRPYARLTPLFYRGAYWVEPRISSHNNYIDLFSHAGLIGVGLFLWFMVEVALLGLRLRKRFPAGFVGGYVSAMLAALAGVAAVMALADWFLPFVYNIGFPGFQASVLVWMFLGGLLALDRAAGSEQPEPGAGRIHAGPNG